MRASQPSTDAHDACPCAGIQGGCLQLMLMMRATCYCLQASFRINEVISACGGVSVKMY